MDISAADPDPAKAAAAEGEANTSTQERLFACCERGQREEIAALLAGRRGLFVNCVNWRGETPLHVVRDLSCAELLLENSGGNQTVLNRQNADGETPLMVALRLGDESLAAFFLDNGADIRPPNKQFQSCLHVATVSGMYRMLDRLLNMRQLDPNQRDRAGNTVLHYAVTYSHVDRATQILDRLLQETQLAVDTPDSASRTAFILAALSGNLTACRLLRDRGCDLCRADVNGADALHAAASASQLDAVRYLVSDLAFSVNRADKLGRTALFYAVYHNAVEALGQLLALGADPGRTDRLGRTPVHVAAEKGHKACLVRLLEAGADPKLADARRQTPLHLAAAYGHLEVVKRLLRYQNSPGDLNARDVDSKSARDLAAQGGHQRVQELLTSEAQARELRSSSFPRPRSATANAKAREREAQKAAEASAARKANELEREREAREETVKEPVPLSHQSANAEAEVSGKSVSSHGEEAPSASIVSSSVSSLKTDPQQQQQQSERTEQRRQTEAAEGCESQGGETETENGPESLTVSHAIPQPEKRSGESRASTSSFSSASTVSNKEPHRKKDATASAGKNSSRPSSHLEEELHGDPRTREAEDSRDDPYLTAAPIWIAGNAASPPSRAKKPQRPEHLQPQQHQQHQQRILRRSKKVSPNIQALRQRLHMYDSTVMLGRLLSEERRERMLTRSSMPPLPQHMRPRRQTRPSTAASSTGASASASAPGVARHKSRGRRDPDDGGGGGRETRQLLDRWKESSGSGRETPSRPPQLRQPHSRPQTASRFLDYFPNDMPPELEDKSG